MSGMGTLEREGQRECCDHPKVSGRYWGTWGAGRGFGLGFGTFLAWRHLEQVVSLCLNFLIYKMGTIRAKPYPQGVP